MSKKLIAVAAAAALALTGLVATPATSAVGAFSVAVSANSGGTGLTADAAYTVKIPTQDVLRFNATEGTTTSVFRVFSTTPGTTDAVRVVTTGGVKAITKTAFDALTATTNKTTAGSQDVSQASVDGNATFYVYSTSTANGTVTVSSGSNSTVFNVKGISPQPYNVVVKNAPATVATSVDSKVDFTITDAFGNAIETTQVASITKVGPVVLSNAASLTWDADRKTHTMTITGSSAGSASVAVELSPAPTKIDAFGTPKTVFFSTAVGGTQAEQITALGAQITALQAQLAALTASTVTKAQYNSLVRKYNRTNPAKKVARVL